MSVQRDANIVEEFARAAYRLGDHLHSWRDASDGLKDNYRKIGYQLMLDCRVVLLGEGN